MRGQVIEKGRKLQARSYWATRTTVSEDFGFRRVGAGQWHHLTLFSMFSPAAVLGIDHRVQGWKERDQLGGD